MSWQGLHIRLAFTVACGALVMAILSSLLAYQRGYQQSLERSERSVRQLMATVNVSAAIAIYVSNIELGNDVVRGLLNNDIVAGAQLRNAAAVLTQAGSTSTISDTAITQELFSPMDENEHVGQLIVLPNQRLIRDRARADAIAIVVQLVLQTLLVAAIVLIAVYLILTRPLTRLSLALHDILPGSPQRLSMPRGHRQDEIGKLTADINTLLDTVSTMLEQERQLRLRVEQLEQRFRGIFEDSSAGIFLINAQGQLVTANPAFLRSIGQSNIDSLLSVGEQFLDVLFVDPTLLRNLMKSALDTGRPCSTDLEFRYQQDGHVRWAHCLISASNNEKLQQQVIEGVLYDITERRQAEEHTRQQAETDALTGMFNRRYVEQLMDQLTATTHRGSFAIFLCDLDRFKQINDTYGHDAGDTVLRVVANRLRLAVREQDIVARLGGDEFLILLHHLNNDTAVQRIASQLLKSLSQPIEIDADHLETVGISIGIAYFPAHGLTVHDLSRHADAAMYAVKRAGRNGFAIWQEQEINVVHL